MLFIFKLCILGAKAQPHQPIQPSLLEKYFEELIPEAMQNLPKIDPEIQNKRKNRPKNYPVVKK